MGVTPVTSLPNFYRDRSTAGKPLHLVGFRIGKEEYCFDILKVQEIIRMLPITTVPSSPPHVEGIINLRGRVVPIIDFRKRFNISGECTVEEAEKVIVVTSSKHATVGFVVDALTQVMKLPLEDLSPAPAGTAGCDAEAIRGIGNARDRLVIVLDLEKMFTSDEISDLKGAISSRPEEYF
jgi:purine-binding chemotaxis protein CheW